MATVRHGFTSRVKGRVSSGPIDPVQQIVETVTASTGGGDNSLYPSGVSIIKTSSAAAYFTLGQPVPGTYKHIVVSTWSSGLTIRTNSTGAGGVYFDSTTFTMIHPSTVVATVQNYFFIAASSILWCTLSGYLQPGSTLVPTSTTIGTSS